MKISVSFLKSNNDLKTTIIKLNNTSCDYIHVDIMDGEFVNNVSYDFEYLYDKLNKVNKKLDVHLMDINPINNIINFAKLKPKYITIHSEIEKDKNTLIDLIHSYKISAGISIKPKTSIGDIEEYLGNIEQVLIMSVEPGMGGQDFLKSILYKIDVLKRLREEKNYHYIINIDGGINNETINYVKDCDMIVSGSYICMSNNYEEQINLLKNN